MSFQTMTWYNGTHKGELQKTRECALESLKTMLTNIKRNCDEDDVYLTDAFKHYDLLVMKINEEDQKVITHHFSINHLCFIAQNVREIIKTKKSESLMTAYVEDIYRIMRVIHKSHTNSFKWENYESDKRFIEIVCERY